MKLGLSAWLERWQPILGDDKTVMAKFGVAQVIPVPPEMQFAWASYKSGVPHKIIGFTNDPNSANLLDSPGKSPNFTLRSRYYDVIQFTMVVEKYCFLFG